MNQQQRNEWNEQNSRAMRYLSTLIEVEQEKWKKLFHSLDLIVQKFKYFADIIYPILSCVLWKFLINDQRASDARVSGWKIDDKLDSERRKKVSLFNDEFSSIKENWENWIMKNFPHRFSGARDPMNVIAVSLMNSTKYLQSRDFFSNIDDFNFKRDGLSFFPFFIISSQKESRTIVESQQSTRNPMSWSQSTSSKGKTRISIFPLAKQNKHK